MTERDIVELIETLFPSSRALLGIGDDAAIVDFGGPVVLSSDLLIEQVDFMSSLAPGLVARKSLAVNLSDLAAMGARPHSFLMSLGLPADSGERVEPFLRALAEAAREWGIELVGGDLSLADKITVSLTVLGVFEHNSRPLLRSGGHPEDNIYVSRQPGLSFLGWKLLECGWLACENGEVQPPSGAIVSEEVVRAARTAIGSHVSPEPEVELGLRLSKAGCVSACIDVSDGLALDLSRVCQASGCGAVIDVDGIGRSADLEILCGHLGLDRDDVILGGGEDYGLLFSSEDSTENLSLQLGRRLEPVGRLEEGSGIWVKRAGKRSRLERVRGFDHFESGGRRSTKL